MRALVTYEEALVFTATLFVLLQLVTPRRFFFAVVKEAAGGPVDEMLRRPGRARVERRNLALHYLPRRKRPTCRRAGANDRAHFTLVKHD